MLFDFYHINNDNGNDNVNYYFTILLAFFCNAEYISPESPSAIGNMLS